MKKHPARFRAVIIALSLLFALCLWEVIASQSPYLLAFKRAVKYDFLGLSAENIDAETAGLGTFTLSETDCAKIYAGGGFTRLVNYSDGYQLDMPPDTEFDFSLAPLYTGFSGPGFDGVISRETATYASAKDAVTFELSTLLPFIFQDSTVKEYVAHYEYRFLLDGTWQENNRVSVQTYEENGVEFISAVINSPGSAEFDAYLYATVYTKSREYLRIMLRYDSTDAETPEAFRRNIADIRCFDPMGNADFDTDYRPILPDSWSSGTRELYDSIAGSGELMWGVFVRDIMGQGIDETVPALEEKLDYHFDVILAYRHFGDAFPTEFMEKNRQDGRITELTWQITSNNNLDLTAPSPMLNIYRGELDVQIRSFARSAAEWGHPFLFRLNNEMNSDWTSYSGVVNMSDPSIYTAVWRRIYDIFQEEGAVNCIWIYNPNDRSSPPSRWNDSLAYFPGGTYVQMLGVTGYNNGTYYSEKWGEKWREFTEIYDGIESLYAPRFSEFPWIITEFASSSIGGDKAKWIDGMFQSIGNYKNIKIAVWFSYADFDGAIPARPYWLDETEETAGAFRRGLHGE